MTQRRVLVELQPDSRRFRTVTDRVDEEPSS